MKSDSIKQYVSLQEALKKEKVALQARLQQIDAALSGGTIVAAARASGGAPAARAERTRRRAKNKLSLFDAVARVASKPMSKPDILNAVQKLGYRFTAKDPMNSLNTLLYSRKEFKNSGGKFAISR